MTSTVASAGTSRLLRERQRFGLVVLGSEALRRRLVAVAVRARGVALAVALEEVDLPLLAAQHFDRARS